jgi:uncharacterized protein YndB with AHSA1/START domain
MNGTYVLEAVRKTVTVDCTVEEAFRVFTADARSWWPVDTHSIHGEKVKDVVFEEREGGTVYEVSEDGETATWATVLAWEPPSRLVLAWEVNPASPGTEVEVRFAEEEGRTRVELEHRGWGSERDEERSSYDSGWDFVLGRYVDRAG